MEGKKDHSLGIRGWGVRGGAGEREGEWHKREGEREREKQKRKKNGK